MAQPLIAATADQMTLAGFSLIWLMPQRHSRSQTLRNLAEATCAYANAVAALVDCREDATRDNLTPLETQLTQLLIYFYQGINDVIERMKTGNAGLVTESGIEESLRIYNTNLQAIGFAAADIVLTPARRANQTILPNRQIMELLLRIRCETLAKQNSLRDLKAEMMNLGFVEDVRQLELKTGLPAVIFACLGHPNPKVVTACSPDVWEGMQTLENVLADARLRRFPQNDNGGEIAAAQRVIRRFPPVWRNLQSQQDSIVSKARWKDSLSRPNRDGDHFLDSKYIKIINGMYANDELVDAGALPARLQWPSGYNHRAEMGRPFHGNGALMFDEMSRCWKCRFLYFYAADPELSPESPDQTAFVANEVKNCAEDLCHHLCRASGDLQQPALPNVHPVDDWTPADENE